MKPSDTFDINESWRWLLQEILLARNAATLDEPRGPHLGKVVLDLLLPSLLYLRTISLFNEALGEYIIAKGYLYTNGSGLNEKLKVLNAQGDLKYSSELRKMKDRRNIVAHRSTTLDKILSQSVEWQEVDIAINVVEAALQHLNLIGQRPDFQFYAERLVELYPDTFHPDKPGVRLTHHHHFGIQEGEARILNIPVSIDYYAMGYSKPEDQSESKV